MSVNPTTGNGPISDSVTSNPGGSNATTGFTVVNPPSLSVTGTAAPNPAATGGQITYTETVTNNSTTTAAPNATLTQSTPPNTTFVSATPPGTWTCGTTPAAGRARLAAALDADRSMQPLSFRSIAVPFSASRSALWWAKTTATRRRDGLEGSRKADPGTARALRRVHESQRRGSDHASTDEQRLATPPWRFDRHWGSSGTGVQ